MPEKPREKDKTDCDSIAVDFHFFLSPTHVHIKRHHSRPVNFGARRDLRDEASGSQLYVRSDQQLHIKRSALLISHVSSKWMCIGPNDRRVTTGNLKMMSRPIIA